MCVWSAAKGARAPLGGGRAASPLSNGLMAGPWVAGPPVRGAVLPQAAWAARILGFLIFTIGKSVRSMSSHSRWFGAAIGRNDCPGEATAGCRHRNEQPKQPSFAKSHGGHAGALLGGTHAAQPCRHGHAAGLGLTFLSTSEFFGYNFAMLQPCFWWLFVEFLVKMS